MSYFSENEIAAAMTVKLDDVLPEKTVFQEGIRRAPDRGFRLTQAQTEIALKNALRYIPKKFHEEVIPEFLEELKGSKKLRNTVVIHLGTNGVINKEAFESSMRMLKGKKVYIMNTVVPKPWEKSVNKSLAEWSQEYDNITIIDWHKYAKGEKQLFYKDATHPKPEGAKKYAEFIFKNIKR